MKPTLILYLFLYVIYSNVQNFVIIDVNYSWLSTKFSDGDFKTVSMVRQPKQPIREQGDVPQETSALSSTGDLFSCPQEGCVRVFQRLWC